TRVPCTCRNQHGSDGSASVSRNDARSIDGPAPRCVAIIACTRGGAGQLGKIKLAFIKSPCRAELPPHPVFSPNERAVWGEGEKMGARFASDRQPASDLCILTQRIQQVEEVARRI